MRGSTAQIEGTEWLDLTVRQFHDQYYLASTLLLAMPLLPSGLTDQILGQEDLARFLTQSSQFNATMVKPAAFLPSPRDRETSVSRHGREPKEQLWSLGLAAAGCRQPYGAAIFKADDVRAAQLDVVADEPPPRHAAIRGWPWIESDPDLQKAQQKEIAAKIASAAGTPFLR